MTDGASQSPRLSANGKTDAREHTARRGIACRGGETYVGDDSGRRFLRIAYLHESDEQIEWGIATLGEVLASCVRAHQ